MRSSQFFGVRTGVGLALLPSTRSKTVLAVILVKYFLENFKTCREFYSGGSLPRKNLQSKRFSDTIEDLKTFL